jgi:dTDP-4-dehydrorhamnose 3,5-epimerase
LRGVHVHPFHSDFLTVISGHLQLCVHDIRKDSPTCGHGTLLSLTGVEPLLAFVPPGVAHGFYFAEPTTYVYGLTTPWSMDEEIGCRWDSPELGITWPVTNPVLSERDAAAGSYADMVKGFEAKQAAGRGAI